MKEQEMERVGKFMADIIKNPTNPQLKFLIKKKIKELCDQFPYY
jgi:glycine/serine hydroxymethyltransferase